MNYRSSNHKRNTQVSRGFWQVVRMVREARALVPALPRVNVSIGDYRPHTVPNALNKQIDISIQKSMIERVDAKTKTAVFREILRSAFGMDFDEKCPLMKKFSTPMGLKTLERLFTDYAELKIMVLS